jgi:hypothetical protein
MHLDEANIYDMADTRDVCRGDGERNAQSLLDPSRPPSPPSAWYHLERRQRDLAARPTPAEDRTRHCVSGLLEDVDVAHTRLPTDDYHAISIPEAKSLQVYLGLRRRCDIHAACRTASWRL